MSTAKHTETITAKALVLKAYDIANKVSDQARTRVLRCIQDFEANERKVTELLEAIADCERFLTIEEAMISAGIAA